MVKMLSEVQVFVYFECAHEIVEGIWHIGHTKSWVRLGTLTSHCRRQK